MYFKKFLCTFFSLHSFFGSFLPIIKVEHFVVESLPSFVVREGLSNAWHYMYNPIYQKNIIHVLVHSVCWQFLWKFLGFILHACLSLVFALASRNCQKQRTGMCRGQQYLIFLNFSGFYLCRFVAGLLVFYLLTCFSSYFRVQGKLLVCV